MHDIKRQLISIALLGILTLGLSFLIYQYDEGRKAYQDNDQPYRNEAHGIAFMLPLGYLLSEKEVGNGERGHYSILLIKKEDEMTPMQGEGPVSISIDIYDNSLDKQKLPNWLLQSNQSNFKLSNGELFETTVGGVSGLSYSWSGLYEADSVALLHKDRFFLFTVTYLGKEDTIRTDFKQLLTTVRFE